MQWDEIQRWNPAPLDECRLRFAQFSARVASARGNMLRAQSQCQWSGHAREAAEQFFSEISTRLHSHSQLLETAASVAGRAGEDVRAIVTGHSDICARAAQQNLVITDAGQVIADPRYLTTPPATASAHGVGGAQPSLDLGGEDGDWQVRALAAARENVQIMVHALLARADELERDVIRALADVLSGDTLIPGADMTGGEISTSTMRSAVLPSPELYSNAPAAAAWWNTLSNDQRQWLIQERPGHIGNLDGVPFSVRDQANRQVLAEQVELLNERAQEEHIQFFAGKDDAVLLLQDQAVMGEDKWEDYLDYRTRREYVTTLGEVMARPGRQLVSYRPDDPFPKAVVATGDIASADHVAIMVPGFTTTIASLDGYDERLQRLGDQAYNELAKAGRADESIATVTWVGYDIPQWDGVFGGNSVLSAQAAYDGGDDLTNFINGIAAERTDDPHLTVLAHSYGSVLACWGLRAEQGYTPVDDLVAFGSPGVPQEAGTPAVTPGHTWHIGASFDVVDHSGFFGTPLNWRDDFTQLESDMREGDDTFYLGSHGHSHYLDPGTTSAHNLALVLAGLHEQVVEDVPETTVRY